MASVMDDVRNALRQWRRAPGVTSVALLSLTLGIGACLALFSLADALLWKSLPVREAEQLTRFIGVDARGDHEIAFPTHVFEYIVEHQSMFEAVTAVAPDRANLASGGEARYVSIAYVDTRYFDVLGVPVILGRPLQQSDNMANATPVAVISHALWQREFGGNPDVLRQTVHLDGHRFDVVGVAPRGFFGLEVGRVDDVIVPFVAQDIVRAGRSQLRQPNSGWLRIYARLPDAKLFDTASAAVRAWYPSLRAATVPPATPIDRHLQYRLDLTPAARGQSFVRRQYAQPLTVLLAAVGVVLLIACGNLAVLAMARFSDRRHEIGVRLSLGGTRSRVIRLLLTESVMLACGGGALGFWLGHALAHAVVPYLTVTRLGTAGTALDLAVDGRLALVAVTGVVVTGLIAGMVPALRASRVDLLESLSSQARGGLHARSALLRMRALAGGQVALSVVLVVGAALLVRSFVELTTRPLGVDADKVLIASISGDFNASSPADRFRKIDRLRGALSIVPGVTHVSGGIITPLSGLMAAAAVTVPGSRATTPTGGYPPFNRVLPGFFDVVGTPFILGRDFNERDNFAGPPGSMGAAIVNQAFANLHFGGLNPIGRVLLAGTRYFEIVGVVANSRMVSVRETRDVAMAYGSMGQWLTGPLPTIQFAVRAERPDRVRAGVLQAIRIADPRLSVELRTMTDDADATVTRERLLAWLGGVFAALGLLMAVVGLYGTFAYAVVRRRGELGVRAALGADRTRLVMLIMREAAGVVVAGVLVGGAAAVAAGRFIEGLLYGINARDATTIALAIVSVLTAAGVATYLPARRAAAVQPAEALRAE